MQILVADDELDERINLTKLIKNLGHIPIEAMSESIILDCFRKKAPDLSFIDFNLAGKSGIDIVRKLRALGGIAAWNPIILTSKTARTTDELILGIEAGADDYFIKPIDPIALKYKIHSAIRNQDLKEQVFTVAHELVVANRALEHLITQDSLTGLANSNSFDEALEREWFRAKKEQHNLSMLLIDLDSFQLFNQKYGADAGDATLVRVANEIKKLCGKNYHLARTSGATFAILMPAVEPVSAQDFAKTICKAVINLAIEHKSSVCSRYVTVSIGVTTTCLNYMKKPKDLLEAVDYALYKAKHSGRNNAKFVLAELVE